MKRNAVLKILNPILAVLLLNQVVTAVFSEALYGEAYFVLHEGGGILLAIVAVVHLILNWNWVKASYFRKR